MYTSKHYRYHTRLGGFRVTIETSDASTLDVTIACFEPESWDFDTVYEFGPDEVITGVELYYDSYVNGMRIHTSTGGVFEKMGSSAGMIGDDYCRMDGIGLVGMDAKGGYILDSIEFQFQDCE